MQKWVSNKGYVVLETAEGEVLASLRENNKKIRDIPVLYWYLIGSYSELF